MKVSKTTQDLVRKITIYGFSAIVAAYLAAWWFGADSNARSTFVVAVLVSVALYFAFLRFRFRLKTVVLITLIVAAIYGRHCNPVYKFVNERRASMAAADLGAGINTYVPGFVWPSIGATAPTLRMRRNRTYAYQLTEKQREQVGERCLRAIPSNEVVTVVFNQPFEPKEMARQLNKMASLQQIVFSRYCDDASLQLMQELGHRKLAVLINAELVTMNGLKAAFPSSSNFRSLQLCTNNNIQLENFSCLRDSKIDSLSVYVAPFFFFNRERMDTGETQHTDIHRLSVQDFHALTEIESLRHLRIAIANRCAPTELSEITAELLAPNTLLKQNGALVPRKLTKEEATLLFPSAFLDRLTTAELTIGSNGYHNYW